MKRPVALSALVLVGLLAVASASASAGTGRTRTLTLAQLKGFRVWEQGPSGYSPSAIPGNVRRSFTVRFKNETRSEVAEIDVRLRVREGSRTTYLSPVFPLRTFDNTGVAHRGSLLPFNKSGGREGFTTDYPGRRWNTGSMDAIEVVAIKVYDGPQDLHDIGHLFTWMANTSDDAIIRRFQREPGLLKITGPTKLNTTLVSFAVSGTTVQKYVLARGGNLLSQTQGGSTVAHLAAFNTNPGVLDFLRSKGIPTDKPSQTGRTPLFKAIEMGNTLSAGWLLAHGADPNRVDREGRNTVYYALNEGQTQIFEALVRAGANPRYHNRNGWGWMHTAAVHNRLMLPYVLRARVSVDDLDPKFGLTPLMAVAQSGEYDLVPWLLSHGANLGAKDAHGKSVYDYARESNTLRADRFFREAVARSRS